MTQDQRREQQPAAPGRIDAPVSAGLLAQQLGDRLPSIDSVPAEAFELTAATRRFVESVVLTDVAADELAAVANELDALAARLRERQRDHLQLVRRADGGVESLRQAGAGKLNPQAPPIEWINRPAPPPPGTPPESVEITARCVFTAAHGGSPGRVYGGVLALVLDEVCGIAIHASGAIGMTVALNVSLRGAVPFGVPVDITARYTGGEGRKSFGSGEIIVDGKVMAEATVVYVAERR